MTLLERDDALAALVRALAASHPQGQVATVSGEAGVGKTALLEALADQSPTASFLWGACAALGPPGPLGPALAMLAATSTRGWPRAFPAISFSRPPPPPSREEGRRPASSSRTCTGPT